MASIIWRTIVIPFDSMLLVTLRTEDSWWSSFLKIKIPVSFIFLHLRLYFFDLTFGRYWQWVERGGLSKWSLNRQSRFLAGATHSTNINSTGLWRQPIILTHFPSCFSCTINTMSRVPQASQRAPITLPTLYFLSGQQRKGSIRAISYI